MAFSGNAGGWFGRAAIRRRQKLDPLRFDSTFHLEADEHGGRVIAPFFHITPRQAREAVASMKGFLTMFRVVRGPLRLLVLQILEAMGKEEAFAGMFVTKRDNPKCAEVNEHLDGLMKGAVETGRELIAAYLTYQEKGTPLPQRFDRAF